MTEACSLADKHCVPCQGGMPPLAGAALTERLSQIDPDWSLIDGRHIERCYRFKNFREALDFTNAVGAIAEEQGHHPDLTTAWGEVRMRVWTHKIDGLSDSDFILAAKADRAYLAR